MSGVVVLMVAGDKIDSGLTKMFEQVTKTLSSPEVEAEEDSVAGPAIEASAAEDGELLGEMIADEIDQDTT